MNNDLISRSELRKVVSEKLIDLSTIQQEFPNKSLVDTIAYNVGIKDCLQGIDNAPTVSFTISPDYVTELQNRNKELIKQLEEAKRSQGDLIQSLTELCNEYCKNCPITDVPNECTDCVCTHIRGIMRGKEE